jgi:hypothetical protein
MSGSAVPPQGDFPPIPARRLPGSAEGVGVVRARAVRAGMARVAGCGVWFGVVGAVFLMLDLYT